MSEKPKAEVITPNDHPLALMANAIAEQHREFCAINQMSPWDFCEALANACGMILASSKDMPRDAALERMDSLRRIMEGAYDLRDVEGSG